MREGTIHVVQKMAPGGIELLVRDLVEQVPGPNLVFSLEGTSSQIQDNWPSLWLLDADVRSFSKGPGISFDLVKALAAKLKDLKPKAVITHHIGPLLYGGAAARWARVPVVAHVEHDSWHFDLPRHKALTRLACKVIRPKLIGVSRPAVETIGKVVGRSDVRLIPNGVNLEKFKPGDKAKARAGWKLPTTARIVGSVGRLEEVKGHDILLDAFAALPGSPILVLAGTGSKVADLEMKARKLGISDRVKFLGAQENVSTLYPAFDVFCLPSRNEGLPLTLLEAQACGVPVVASEVGAVPDAMCPETGRLVPPGDPLALTKALNAVFFAPPEGSPRSFVAQGYGWGKTLAAYKALTGV